MRQDERDRRMLAWKARQGAWPRAIEIASFTLVWALLLVAAIYAVRGLIS